jgi:SET domain-containing protein
MESIKEINTYVRTYLAPSDIHGVGVFALYDMKEGEPLFADMVTKIFFIPYQDFDKIRPEIAEQILSRWPLVVNDKPFAYPDVRIVAYMNHSDEPNYDAVNDKLLRDVKKGEELTEDYRKIEGHEKVFDFLVV